MLKFLTLVYGLILTAILGWLGVSFEDAGVTESGETAANAAIHSIF